MGKNFLTANSVNFIFITLLTIHYLLFTSPVCRLTTTMVGDQDENLTNFSNRFIKSSSNSHINFTGKKDEVQ